MRSMWTEGISDLDYLDQIEPQLEPDAVPQIDPRRMLIDAIIAGGNPDILESAVAYLTGLATNMGTVARWYQEAA